MVRVPGWIHAHAGGWPNSPQTRPGRPWSAPLHLYTSRVRTPIDDGTGQVIVSGGVATVQVGPSGLGVRWYPVQGIIATTSGAADASTCTIYKGVIAASTQIGGQSYAGGGDTFGLAGLDLQAGEFLIAVWAGAKNGDIATLRILGVRSSLVAH